MAVKSQKASYPNKELLSHMGQHMLTKTERQQPFDRYRKVDGTFRQTEEWLTTLEMV